MPNTILNDPSAGNNAATYIEQARPDKGDVDAWTAGHQGFGVLSGGAVTQHGIGGMSVDVSALSCVVNNNKVDSFNAVSGLTISAADTSHDRIDLIVATDGTGIQVVAGTAASTPVWASIPANSVLLGMVVVPANATQILTANIVDKRVMVTPPYFVRQSVSHLTASSLAPNAQELTSITLAKSYRLLSCATSVPARVRLYDRAAKQTADASRSIGTIPTGDHGLEYEFVGSSTLLSADASPAVIGSSMESSPSALIPLTIDNLSGLSQQITVTLNFMGLE